MTKEKSGLIGEEKEFKSAGSGAGMGAFGKFLIILLFLAVVAAFAWYFMKYREAQKQVNFLSSMEGRQEVDKMEIEKVVSAVGKLILLSETEMPTIATIEDAAALATEQAFFSKAQNGDKILIYSDRAIIYSVERNLLVNVGPVFFNNDNAEGQTVEQEEPTPVQPEKKVKVEPVSLDIRNGSKVQGVAQNLAGELSAQGVYSLVNVSNASNTDYPKTVLVNLGTGDVSALEERFGVVAVSVLPEGEAVSTASVVIIMGNE
ncbi:MAG: LytR C-terminal domain-containing protein [bacterium]|nr:LytR C-terminal domain-containing protein [bacterium]